ncbi:MAG: hypothetical protein KAS04_05135 [Candidatus Aenigmarchaeota archaeon]|nr:hypothetical protein [Candidatus Aenigmarchaeota archaeon]
MPGLRIHCRISKDRTGCNFKDLHEWIDEPRKRMGVNHRKERHSYNLKDENKIRKFWESKSKGMGNKAVVEWLFHIAIDNLWTAFKRADKVQDEKKLNFFKFGLSDNSRFIHYDFKSLDVGLLKEEFDNSYEEDEWECEYCGECFPTEKEADKHEETCSMEWECKYCGEIFKNKIKLNEHEEDCKNREWKCEHCGITFNAKFKCDKHEKDCFEYEWECEYCGKEFPTEKEADKHEETCKK